MAIKYQAMTHSQLADCAGVSRRTLYNWLRPLKKKLLFILLMWTNGKKWDLLGIIGKHWEIAIPLIVPLHSISNFAELK